MQSLKQFILVAAVLATMIGRTKAFDFVSGIYSLVSLL